MKLVIATLTALSGLLLAASASANNYAEMERKEAARLEQSRRDFAAREQNRQRTERETREKWQNWNKPQSTTGSKPGRMMDIDGSNTQSRKRY